MTKRELLASLTFGQRIAEDEADALASYFVETEQWRKILSGEADVVYGPKGSGKSALPRCFKAALPIVSSVRYNQTLCAEHAAFKPWMTQLEGEKTQQTPVTLARIWKTSEPEALSRAEKLSEIGFFEKRGTKDQPIFWVPFLYRDALHLVQGPAD